MLKSFKLRVVYLFSSLIKYPLVFTAFLVATYLVVIKMTSHLLAIVFILVCGLVLLLKKYKLHLLFVVISVLAVTFFYKFKTGVSAEQLFAGLPSKQVKIMGVVVNYPYRRANKQIVVVKILEIQELGVKILPGLVQARIPWQYLINKGDNLEIIGIIKPIENFNGFDYQAYLKTFEIYAQIDAVSSVKVLTATDQGLADKVYQVRLGLITNLRRLMPEPHASLLLGMLIGSKEDFPGEFEQNLRLSGTTHIIAVSGFNVTVIVQFLLSFAGLVQRKLLIVLIALGLLIYLILVGSDNTPALRATIMGWTNLLGQVIGRKGAVINLLALALLVMVINNPLLLWSLSFQLSFAATLGLIFLSDPLIILLQKFIPKVLAAGLAVTLSANLATFPISFSSFGQLVIWSPLANILVGPLVPIIMLCGSVLALSSMLGQFITQILTYVCWFLLNLLVEIIKFCAHLPLADLHYQGNLGLIALIFCFVMLLVAVEIQFRNRRLL